MRYRLLGPLEVDVAGRRLEISATRDRVLLVMLLLQPNRVVTLPRLVDAVWGDAAPATARAQLHTCVSRLRRQLPGAIQTDTAGYRAAVEPDELDTLVFAQLVADGRAAMAAGELHTARKHLRDALDLWRGPALAGVDSPSVQAAAVALEERHNSALEDCIDVELQLGLQAELISQLTGLAEQHPLRERLHGQLMTALARVGRTADAIAVYLRLTETLDEQLGLAPSAALQELYRNLLQPPAVLGSAAPAPAPRALPIPTPWTLPRDVADFAGREELVTRLVRAAQPGRGGVPVVLTVDGMAGVGKTSLAVHVAHLVADRYPDGRLFVDLRAHGERPPLAPHDAVGLLLRHLGVDPERIPADPDERVARWRSELAARRLLVVLDNAADPAQVTPLLPGASASLVLITSRRRLGGLDGAHSISLDVLDDGDAVRFVTTVVGARAEADPRAVADVVRLCGGLPLALRLSAARLAHRPGWSVADLADRLRQANPAPIDLTVDGRSPHAAFELSYRALDEPARRLFRLTGLHPSGEFAVRVAAALADLPIRDADELLGRLVDAHLLIEPVAGRFRLHDLLREYAAQLAAADPEADAATTRMLDFYLQAAAAATRPWENGRHRGAIDAGEDLPWVPRFTDLAGTRRWLDAEIGNVIAVTALADRLGRHRHTCLLPRAVWGYLFRNSMNDISTDLHRRALTAAEALADDDLIAMTHNYLASAYARAGNQDDAARHLHAITEHPVWGARARSNLAAVYLYAGRLTEALDLLEQSLQAIYPAEVMVYGGQWPCLTTILRLLGRTDEAVASARHALAVGRSNGTQLAINGAIELAVIRESQGRHRQAELLLRWIVGQTAPEAGMALICETRSYLGVTLVAMGRTGEGLALLELAARDSEHLDPHIACLAASNYGAGLRTVGRRDEAKAEYARALERAMRAGYRYEQARAYHGLGLCTDDPRLSRQRLQTAADLYKAMGVTERVLD
ncbi:AfsR/SARP family transcriptional regulator [Dactylosporangium matsuzakiense]|uniref:AfsR/SARP family transcriptional regulator n=1 Tax=Dactylosporangium matsuzakiense TaxID=53360 RepID=UPI0022F302C2|nr:BTAD domain-containing putative transcriptional regulator [Dactylosporangium matsuzakiense]